MNPYPQPDCPNFVWLEADEWQGICDVCRHECPQPTPSPEIMDSPSPSRMSDAETCVEEDEHAEEAGIWFEEVEHVETIDPAYNSDQDVSEALDAAYDNDEEEEALPSLTRTPSNRSTSSIVTVVRMPADTESQTPEPQDDELESNEPKDEGTRTPTQSPPPVPPRSPLRRRRGAFSDRQIPGPS